MSKGFKGLPGNMQALMQQAQKMQADIQRVQAESEAYNAEGSAGGGMVKAVANGKYQLVSLWISPEVVEPSSLDREMLQDLITAAVNEAMRKVQTHAQEAVSKVTGGASLGGML